MKHLFFFIFFSLIGTTEGLGFFISGGLKAGSPANSLTGAGIEGDITLEDLAFGASFMTGTTDMKSSFEKRYSDLSFRELKATSTLSLIEMRYFLFWGINISVGIGQRTLGLIYDVGSLDGTASLKGNVKAVSTIGSSTLGFRWSILGVYFGFDGGYTFPASSTVVNSSQTSGALGDQQAEDSLTLTADKMGKSVSSVISFSLGVSI